MGFGAELPGTKLTFLSWLSTTSGALHGQCFFLGDFHGYILRLYSAARWSILTSAFKTSVLSHRGAGLVRNRQGDLRCDSHR